MDYKSKVAKIYEVMADKTLSFGCYVIAWHDFFLKTIETDYLEQNIFWRSESFWQRTEKLEKIIWHPLHIWHVLNWMYHNIMVSHRENRILDLMDKRPHKQFSKPLPINPDKERGEVIDFIYWLIE